MYRLHNLAPKHLIVDTMVVRGTRRTLRLHREADVEDIRSAAQDAYSVDRVMVAWLTVRALQLLLSAYGFEVESMYDWNGRLAGRPLPGLEGYAKGNRVTLRCRSREAAIAAGWDPVAPLAVAAGPPPGIPGRERSPAAPCAAGRWVAREGQQDADQSHRLRASASVHQAFTARRSS
jgi:hypothetical protein